MRKIVVSVVIAVLVAAGVALFMRSPTQRRDAGPGVAVASAPVAPSGADSVFADITAGWTNEQRSACAGALREVLGTRELVQGALDAVKDPQNRAADEIADAKHWLRLGNESFEAQRAALLRGDCSAEVKTGLEQATQHYIKAGTSAVQAGQIAGS